jgi:hypothetical protein
MSHQDESLRGSKKRWSERKDNILKRIKKIDHRVATLKDRYGDQKKKKSGEAKLTKAKLDRWVSEKETLLKKMKRVERKVKKH